MRIYDRDERGYFMFSVSMTGFTAVVILYALIVALVCTLCGRRRSVPEAGAFLGLTFLAGIVAFLVARGLRGVIGDVIYDEVFTRLGTGVGDFMALSPSGEAGVRELMSYVVAPALFLALFILILLFLRLTVGIPVHLVLRKKKKDSSDSKKTIIPGMAMGICSGMLIVLMTLAPLCGYMLTVSHTVDTLLDTGVQQTDMVQDMLEDLDTDEEEVRATVEAVEKNIAVRSVNAAMGWMLYGGLTSGSGQSGEVVVPANLEAELCYISDGVGHGLQVYQWVRDQDDQWKLGEEDKDSIQALCDALLASDWLTEVGAEAVSGLATAWSDGEACMGMKRPTVDSIVEPVVEEALVLFSRETPALLEQDLDTVLDMLEELVQSRILRPTQSVESLMEQVGQSGLLNKVSDTLNENAHLAPLVDAFHTMSIRLVASVMETDLLQDGRYDDMLDQVAETLTNVLELSPEEREATVRQAVQESFETYDIDVPDDVAVVLSEQAIQSLGEDGEITGAEIREYLLEHVEDAGDVLEDVIEDLP